MTKFVKIADKFVNPDNIAWITQYGAVTIIVFSGFNEDGTGVLEVNMPPEEVVKRLHEGSE